MAQEAGKKGLVKRFDPGFFPALAHPLVPCVARRPVFFRAGQLYSPKRAGKPSVCACRSWICRPD